MQIALGCQNRPWHQHTLEEALDGIAAADFTRVGLTGQQGKWAFTADSTDEDLSRLRRLFNDRHLKLQMAIKQPNLWRKTCRRR
jgi:sugar phosphate isomerase/epimerase